MNKDKIIKDIRDKLNCSEEAANEVFSKGLEDGMIKARLNWEYVVSFVICTAVLISAIWAAYRLMS